MNSIDCVDNISSIDFHKNYFQAHKPLLIKGGGKNLKCCKSWNFTSLKERFSDQPVRMFYSETGYFNSNYLGSMTPFMTPFGEGVDYCTSENFENKSYYMKMLSIEEVFPELLQELEPLPWSLPDDIINSVNMWVGGAGCITSLHFDFAHNFFVQVEGKKEFTLFSPEDTPYLYASETGKNNVSQVDIDRVDEAQFPLFHKATPLRCMVEPGDILFNPPGWWHHVRSLDNAISVTSWWNRFELIFGAGLENFPVEEIAKDISYFIKAGLPVDYKGVDGEYLLITAIEKGYANVVEALLSLGANPNLMSIVSQPGKSALDIAIESENATIAGMLLKQTQNKPAWFNMDHPEFI